MTHGTKAAYDRHKCRCDDCKAANTAYQRGRRRNIAYRDANRPKTP